MRLKNQPVSQTGFFFAETSVRNACHPRGLSASSNALHQHPGCTGIP
ncbi:hypothetical protein F385_1632 [Pantoea agglomerans 299R]|nr:hypothetical protein F385_1632 [Pantoea agglomerans 299R]